MIEYAWFHVTVKKIERFTGADGMPIPQLIAGDTYKMSLPDAKRLEDQGAGRIRRESTKDCPMFQTAERLRGGDE